MAITSKAMKQELESYLQAKFQTKDLLEVEFRPIENVEKEDIDFRKVRGSVRLMLRRILTPSDVKRERERVLSKKLPS